MSDQHRDPQGAASPQGSRISGATSNKNQHDSGASSIRSRFNELPAANNRSTSQTRAASQRHFSPFGRRSQHHWAIVPVHDTVVRFELEGLGDPFYRLLGHDLNTDYGNNTAVINTLEQGGEAVLALENKLNATWREYKLHGATLVYRWHPRTWSRIAGFPLVPDRNSNPSGNDNADEGTDCEPSRAALICMRSIDLELVLNILTRARTQVLLARAPIVFSQQYLARSLVSDDPRLIDLARSTGYLEEII